MKRLIFTVLFFSGCATTHTTERGTALRETLGAHPVAQDLPPPATYEVARWEEASGLKVIFIHDETLPLVRGSLMIPGGTLSDVGPEFGEVPAFAGLLRGGGAGSLTANALDEKLQKLAASVSSGAGPETVTVSFSSLTPDIDTVFSIFKDVLTRPRFDQDRVELFKLQSLEEIRRRKDSPETVAGIGLKKMLFPGDSPLSKVTTSSSIARINRARLVALATERIGQRADNGKSAVFVICGSLNEAKAKELSFSLSQTLPTRLIALPALPIVAKSAHLPEIAFVEQPLTQSTVFLGVASPARDPTLEPTIDLFNTYFGKGGFGSVLMKRVRTELGLAYGVYGTILQAPVSSRSIMVVQTKSESTGKAVSAMLHELQSVQNGSIEPPMLEESRRAELNGYPFLFDSAYDVAMRAGVQSIVGYPKDFDATYPGVLNKVSGEQVSNLATKYFPLSDIKIVLVGSAAARQALEQELSTFPVPLNSLKVKQAVFDEIFKVTADHS